METNYQHAVYDYVRSADQDAPAPVRRPVVVVGAGPVGLSAAIDLARHGVPVVLLDDDCSLSAGSRAICFAKRTLEIFDRLGCGDPIVAKGVRWNIGKVFFRDELVYEFNLLPESGHRRPAFINLQQYYVEGFLLDHALSMPGIDIRWKNTVVGVTQDEKGVLATIDTPDGEYQLQCDYLVAADGARSPIRAYCGLQSKGQTFHDRFLIADVKMKAEFPPERWFWFDPPFHPNQSVLLHRQPDNVWRIDFQLGWDADPVEEKKPENVIPRITALLGRDAEFELEWVSIYTFSCVRMERFRHGRVLFAGDCAHGVSPFGARGANSGVQDADNLAWKLKLVLDRKAPDALLDSYCDERQYAADENIRNSTRSTDFITPKSDVSRCFRDVVLRMAKRHEFARRLVNSGRLSVPATLSDSVLNTPDRDAFAGAMVPGAAVADAPVRVDGREHWLASCLGDRFTGLYFSGPEPVSPALIAALQSLADDDIPVQAMLVAPPGHPAPDAEGICVIEDTEGFATRRFDAKPGSFYLIRPDQHVCARWRSYDAGLARQAVLRATANSSDLSHEARPACAA
jgi:3-(3-hydroxy-phenyl)propionate hydroxylase